RLRELIGSDCEFVPCGHLKLARSEADVDELERYAADAADIGLKLEMIGASRIRSEYPWLGSKVVGASLSPMDGHANPRLVTPTIGRAARTAGADLREFTRVVETVRDGELFSVRCATGLEVSSRFLVNTAGAWAGQIAAAFGEPVPIAIHAPG